MAPTVDNFGHFAFPLYNSRMILRNNSRTLLHTNAQINRWPDGSIEILSPKGLVWHVKDEQAENYWTEYQQLLKFYPDGSSLRVADRIDVPQPIGEYLP
jgi:hypothetical protein